jgi:APA family basic amino acid/polyamine antiporter
VRALRSSEPVKTGRKMGFVRSIGRWTLTALVINCIIGSGIFGVPGGLSASLGRASPLATIVGGLGASVILACFAEVGSRFTEAGGVYLYARTAFGLFVGQQVGWFLFLSSLAAAAASAHLFMNYLAGFMPSAAQGWPRLVIITLLVLLPALVNYTGVRRGAMLSTIFTIAKLLPLGVLILLGLSRLVQHPQVPRISEVIAPGWSAWGNALLLLISFIYSGYEDITMPGGEIKEPRRTIPFAMIAGMIICTAVYTLLQLVVVATVGTGATERPLAASASLLIGRGGEVFVEIGAMVSTYGWLSASMLNAPRFLFSLADRREFPAVFGKLHSRYNTPHASVALFAVLVWLLAVTGSFRWAALLSAGATTIFDCVICAALPRLRRLEPIVVGFRLPFGAFFSAMGVLICAVLLCRLEFKQAALMSITALVAAGNWWWAGRRASPLVPTQPIPAAEIGKPVS